MHRAAIWGLRVNSTRHIGADRNFRYHWTSSEFTPIPASGNSWAGLHRTPSLEVVNGVNRESFRRSPQILAQRTERGFPNTQKNWEITFLFSTLSCPSPQIIQWWQQEGLQEPKMMEEGKSPLWLELRPQGCRVNLFYLSLFAPEEGALAEQKEENKTPAFWLEHLKREATGNRNVPGRAWKGSSSGKGLLNVVRKHLASPQAVRASI